MPEKKIVMTKERLSGLFLVITAALYVALTFAAMQFYPGEYSFTGHTFSRLGQTKVGGVDNAIARILLIVACSLVAVALVPFFFYLPVLFEKGRGNKLVASRVGSACGVSAAPFLVLIALIPMDLYPAMHQLVTDAFFLLVAAAILAYALAVFLDAEYRNIYGVLFVALSAVTVLYTFRVFDAFRPVAQKILVYAFIAWIFAQTVKIWRMKPEV